MNTARKLIANELLPVYQTTDTGEKIVDGRELHNVLNVGRDFTTWMKERIQKYGFVEKEDFSPILGKTSEQGGRPATEYILKLDMAKELAMVENNEQGRKARKYFIEVEKRMHNVVPLQQVPTDSSFVEYDQINRLLQMLKLGTREKLFTEETDRALRHQIAEMVTGEKGIHLVKSDHSPKTKPEGRGIKDIANSLGVTYQKAVWVAKKNNLKKPEYGAYHTYDYKGQQKEIFIYNDAGKGRLCELLNVQDISEVQH